MRSSACKVFAATISWIDDAIYCLGVTDDGAGFPTNFAPDEMSGLGMKVISSLVRNLQGNLSYGPAHGARGTCFEVTFPVVSLSDCRLLAKIDVLVSYSIVQAHPCEAPASRQFSCPMARTEFGKYLTLRRACRADRTSGFDPECVKTQSHFHNAGFGPPSDV